MRAKQATTQRPIGRKSVAPQIEDAPAWVGDIGATDGPLLLSVTQAAKRIGIGRTVLYPHVMSGRLPNVVLGTKERMVIAAAIPGFIAWLWGEQRVMLGMAS